MTIVDSTWAIMALLYLFQIIINEMGATRGFALIVIVTRPYVREVHRYL